MGEEKVRSEKGSFFGSLIEVSKQIKKKKLWGKGVRNIINSQIHIRDERKADWRKVQKLEGKIKKKWREGKRCRGKQEDVHMQIGKYPCSAPASHGSVEGKAWSFVLVKHISLLSVAGCLPSRQFCICVGRPGYHNAKGSVSRSLATSCLL